MFFLNKTKFIRRTKKLKLEISQISDKNSHKIKIYSTEALEALSYLKMIEKPQGYMIIWNEKVSSAD